MLSPPNKPTLLLRSSPDRRRLQTPSPGGPTTRVTEIEPYRADALGEPGEPGEPGFMVAE